MVLGERLQQIAAEISQPRSFITDKSAADSKIILINFP